MSQKNYVSLSKLSTFLDKLAGKFAALTHDHKLSEIKDYSIDSALSPTSTNPVQNSVIDAEFEAVSQAMLAMDLAIDDLPTEEMIPNLYVWKKYDNNPDDVKQTPMTNVCLDWRMTSVQYSAFNIDYSDGISTDGCTITLTDKQSINIYVVDSTDVLLGKYIYASGGLSGAYKGYYFIPEDATFTISSDNSDLYVSKATKLSIPQYLNYVASKSFNTYTTGAQHTDGYWYKYIKRIGDSAVVDGSSVNFIETDPTVPAWAKAANKPSYTAAEVGARPNTWMPSASEVGALPSSTIIPTVPTNVSAFTNDAGYLTQHQDISGLLPRTELPTAINTALEQAKASGEFDGADGVSPTISVGRYDNALGSGVDLSITHANGDVDMVQISDGKDGENGFSAFASVTKSGNVATITTRDNATGTQTVEVYDGEDYVLTEADKAEIAELAAGLVDVPDSGGESNILIVTVSNSIASHSPAEIKEASDAGKLVVMRNDGVFVHLGTALTDKATFVHSEIAIAGSSGIAGNTAYTVNADKSVTDNVEWMWLPPSPTEEDEGKVLTTVNGKPEWRDVAHITSTGDTTDRLAEIQTLLDNNGYVKLGNGEFYLSGQLRIRNGATLDGCGKATVIKQTPDSTQPSMIWLQSEGTIRNVCLQGEWTAKPTTETAKSSTRIGIVISGGTNNAIIDGCWIVGWTGQATLASTNSTATRSFLMSNCDVRWNNIGLKTEESEYACIANCTFRENITGVLNNGGNNKFVGCGFDSNYDGFVINEGYNNGHGSCNGCTFNHNEHYAVNMAYTELGFVFSGCNFAEGTIRNTKSKGIMFSGCRFGNWLKYNNYTTNVTLFSGCIFSHSPKTESSEWLDSYGGYKFINCRNYLTGEVINDDLGYSTPEMHGAIGDGVNDDASAFTNAINDSDCVFLTGDLYLFTPVAITGKTRLVVDGNGHTINCKNIERALQITDSTNIVFKNIIFDGNSCTTQGVTFINCENIQVEKCTFKNMTTSSATDGDTWGLNFRDSKDMRVDFCSFLNIDGSGNSARVANGIVVHGHTKGCENVTISNCYFDTILPVSDACGISLNQSSFYDTPLHGVVENCLFVDCAKRAIKIMAQYVTVKNCDIKDVLSTDIHASMIDIMASHCRVTNNTINVNSATYGISCQYVAETSTITGFDDIVIENNYINVANEDSTTARDGLSVGIVDDTKKYTEVVIKNNVVKGRFRYCFKAMNISNSVIDGNTFEGESRFGNRSLNDRPCANNRIVNNTMKGTFEASVTDSVFAHNTFTGGGFGLYFPTFTNGSPSKLRIVGNKFDDLTYGIDGRRQAMDNVVITENIFTNITTYDMHLLGTNYVLADNVPCKGVSGTYEVVPPSLTAEQIGALPLSGGKMTGTLYGNNGISLTANASSANNAQGITLNNSGNTARISLGGSGGFGIYSDQTLFIRPSYSEGSGYGVKMTKTDMSPTTNASLSLGTSSSMQYNNIYGKTLYQNGKQVANKEDVPTNKETWTFTLEDGSTVTKAVYIG